MAEILSHAQAKGEESLNDFKFGTFIVCVLSDRAANMAVKGLTTLGEHAGLFEVVRMRSVHMIIDGLNIYIHTQKTSYIYTYA